MGNIMEDAAASVHGVLYRIQPHDFARLTNMEHEYRRVPSLLPCHTQKLLICYAEAQVWALHLYDEGWLVQQYGLNMPACAATGTRMLHNVVQHAWAPPGPDEGCACMCRPTEVIVEAYDNRPPVRAVAFVSSPDVLIKEGLPPSERYEL